MVSSNHNYVILIEYDSAHMTVFNIESKKRLKWNLHILFNNKDI